MSTPLLGGCYNFLWKSKSQWKKEGGRGSGLVEELLSLRYCSSSKLLPTSATDTTSVLHPLWGIPSCQTTVPPTFFYFDSFIIDSTTVSSIQLPLQNFPILLPQTLFSPPSPAAVQSYICQKESYTRDRILSDRDRKVLTCFSPNSLEPYSLCSS